ncbi:RNA polymerase sigma factor SigJ [Streptomyces sp. NPDC051162]|uniref:RNA polymerase sigma factor SigJ n=1 Tax=Streptomyces sp. NPDC051162 TaxID=3154747 RepID=UPI00343C9AA4
MAAEAPVTDPFEEYWDLLFGISYRMLGTVADAEDVVQETWLRWRQADPGEVANPRGYLVRAVTRTAIDHLRRSRARREEYVGPWLPEPLLTSPDVADTVALAESVDMAFLVMLEALSPVERAVFVLHEVFAIPYPEIAGTVGRSHSSVRQIGHRSRQRVEGRQQRYRLGRRERREAVEHFVSACLDGDLDALLRVLAPEVTMWADSDGKSETPRVPLHGARTVAEYFASVAALYPPDVSMRVAEINGGPAAVVVANGTVFAVVGVDVEPSGGRWRITAVRAVRNPAKLRRIPVQG